ncbi:MAG: nuclear transport factor 2 family protein [Flavobacteriales bacterium]|nr:nuclear transport factor 2 family protein [Flavobacteriales bacterium]
MKRIFSSILLLFVLSCSNTMKETNTLLQSVITAINARNPTSIAELASDDISGNTTDGQPISGKNALQDQWAGIFRIFPDFSISVEKTITEGPTSIVIGTISGSLYGKKKDDEQFNLPCTVKMEMASGKLTSSVFYTDFTKIQSIRATQLKTGSDAPGVTGLGGVFFKAKDPKSLIQWYNENLGLSINEHAYMVFEWRDDENPALKKSTTFSIFNEKTEYLSPSEKPFMINFRVNHIDALFEKFRAAGIQTVGEIDRFDYGNFGWIMDPEGNKIELWEPVDSVLEAYEDSVSHS